MMKRIFALMLVLCAVMPLFPSACAETAPFRFVTNAINLVEDWLEEHHPDIAYENLYDTANSWRTDGAHTEQVLDALQSGDAPDLLMLESSLCDFGKVLKSGLVEDVSANEDICAALSQMYEPFQVFVTGEDGGIYGVLYGVYGFGMHLSFPRHGRRRDWTPPTRLKATRNCWTSPVGGLKGWRQARRATSA